MSAIEQRAGAGHATRMLLGAGLALGLALLVGLVAAGKAQAADCMSETACVNQAKLQYLTATQRQNESNLYRAASTQQGQKGNWGAAYMYAVAADQKANEAGLLKIAAQNSYQRALFFGHPQGGEDNPATPSANFSEPGSCPASEDFCIASTYPKTCKRVSKPWTPKIGGTVVYKAVVETKWCWRGPSIVSRKTNPSEHHVTNEGQGTGIVDRGVYKDDSYCNDYNGVHNHNCLTRYQFGFSKTSWCPNPFEGFSCTRIYGGCIGTRIYGDRVVPPYSLNAYGGDCKGD